LGKHCDELLSRAGTADAYAAYDGIREAQVAAINERLQEQRGKIKLVDMRAKEAGVDKVRSLEDAVPLLLPHTAYKSYPESFLKEKKWDRLTKWLGTVSAYPTNNVDLSDVREIDDWVEACGRAGHFVSCSSGTTGKSAMLVATKADLDFASRDGVAAVQWGSDIRAGDMRTMAGPAGAVAYTPRNAAMGQAMLGAFVDPAAPRFQSGLPPVTVGSLTKMITLRQAIADGAAKPSDIAEYESQAASREQGLADALAGSVEDIISKRGERLYITGMWGALYPSQRRSGRAASAARTSTPRTPCTWAAGSSAPTFRPTTGSTSTRPSICSPPISTRCTGCRSSTAPCRAARKAVATIFLPGSSPCR
jgi:hypothetical protein